MFEKVNCSHVDKVADRIAGAMVDMAYKEQENPKVAVEVLIGHGRCFIVCESSVRFDWLEVKQTVDRIVGNDETVLEYVERQQDEHLARNQERGIRCGDNGIFKGCPVTEEQRRLTDTMKAVYEKFHYDGKAVLDNDRIILCHSHVEDYRDLLPFIDGYRDYLINPLGPWTGGTDVDTGATNRKLGSDMGDAVTGGGLHGKDLSKADVSMNIGCHIIAQAYHCPVRASCAIGDNEVTFHIDYGKTPYSTLDVDMPYAEVVEEARKYVRSVGGFERLAEWGLI